MGLIRGLRALAVLALFDRKPKPGELVMDGIAVHPDFRGQGIGTQLLERVVGYAAGNGFLSVRLDVIDTNPDARRLYERFGFRAVREEKFSYLSGFLGFGSATTLVILVEPS